MPSNSPIKAPSFGRTFVVAATLLATVAVVQLGAVTVAFFKSTGIAGQEDGAGERPQPPLKIDVNKLIAESPPPDDPPSFGPDPLSTGGDERPSGLRPIPNPPDGTQGTGELPVKGGGSGTPIPPPISTGNPPRPTPVPLSAFTPKVDPRFSELVEQGKLLRGSGDTAGALLKFREAATIDPGNPLPIAEQAFTFEKMSLPDKAAEQWKRILVMGDRAGVYFSAAKSKLETAMQTTVRETVGGGAELPAGKTMGLGKAGMIDDPDPAAAKKFLLNVPIRARASGSIAVQEMKIFVLFYDRLNGKDIMRTSANVTNRWASPPADWRDGDTETLEVTYELPLQAARGDRREYYGYIVRLYYHGELQDTQAEPASLNQKYPAPYTLSE
jgi:hypothetical protein